jgi:hypothetical protein
MSAHRFVIAISYLVLLGGGLLLRSRLCFLLGRLAVFLVLLLASERNPVHREKNK